MNHRARRRFGQNFLHDANTIKRIIAAIAASQDDHVVEIGPGQGALTEGLAATAGKLTLIELDRDLGAVLQQRFASQDHIELIMADALKVDLGAIADNGRLRLVGNLPYNISTPLLFHFFRYAAVISDMTLMLQKEVALRLLAEANTADYGRLSVMSRFYCRGELLLAVPPGAFRPAPKVDSAVVRLYPTPPPFSDASAQSAFADVVRHAFGQRRKTLRNSLRPLLSADQITTAGIDPGRRAETLDLDDYVALTRTYLASAAG
ncbi:MAG: 16S rRNA (adenine(1518)-N(6)/adenine(1519)-N(6)) -dimethyltransferase RsmA [Wenzhouxiangellaceae bacterium]